MATQNSQLVGLKIGQILNKNTLSIWLKWRNFAKSGHTDGLTNFNEIFSQHRHHVLLHRHRCIRILQMGR